MCPDKEILSAYFDGEIDEIFARKIKGHIDHCEKCQKVLAEFGSLKNVMNEDPLDIESSMERVKERLDFDLSRKFRKEPFWKTNINIPIPVAAAAAVLIILFLGTAVIMDFSPGKSIPVAAKENTEEIFNNIEADNIEEVVRFFNTNNIPIEVNININEGPEMTSSWEPELIRAVDYKRNYR